MKFLSVEIYVLYETFRGRNFTRYYPENKNRGRVDLCDSGTMDKMLCKGIDGLALNCNLPRCPGERRVSLLFVICGTIRSEFGGVGETVDVCGEVANVKLGND